LDALIVPSLQTNFSPRQCETPPFFPEHGWRPRIANAAGGNRTQATSEMPKTRRSMASSSALILRAFLLNRNP
jgi:hypothetical protein